MYKLIYFMLWEMSTDIFRRNEKYLVEAGGGIRRGMKTCNNYLKSVKSGLFNVGCAVIK